MDIALWICQGLLAVVFAVSGAYKISKSKQWLVENGQTGVVFFPLPAIRAIATLELLGVLAIILPWATGIAPILTPLAAVGFALLMVGAAICHAKLREPRNVAINVVIFVVAVFVAYGQFTGAAAASGRFRRVGIEGAPDRVCRAVQALSIRPADRVLEVGCGNGWAVSLICDKLRSGRILAIDRSTAMIALAKQRNEEHIASGKAQFRTIDLIALPAGTDTYHKIFAINVNTFWRRPLPRELELLKKLLRPKGSVYLFFESPAPRADDLAARVVKALQPNGWLAESIHLDGTVMMVTAQPA